MRIEIDKYIVASDPQYWTESKDFKGEINGVSFYADR